MRISIDADPPGPLKVIRELPSGSLAVLEGLNGIGKTLAVRLLELCAGTVPWTDSATWASLCHGLGEFQVTATELRGVNEIRWRADSRDWVSPDGVPTSVRFRSITIDGLSASMDSVRTLFAVHRIGGDEGLLDTLAYETNLAAEIVRRWGRRYADPNDGPLARLESAAAISLRLLGDRSLESYRALAANTQDARVQATAAAKVLERAQTERDAIARAVELRHELAALRGRAPGLSQRLREVEARIQAIETSREDLQLRGRRLTAHLAVSQAVQKDLLNARRTVTRNRQNLSSSLNRTAILAAELHIDADTVSLAALRGELQEQVTHLELERQTLDAAPAMRGLLDQVTGQLAAAEGQGLADQVAFDDPTSETQLTVAQTRAGMTTRRAFLEGKPPPPQAKAVIQQLEEARRLLSRAGHLKFALDEADRYKRLVAQNESRVSRALAALDPKAIRQWQSLESDRRRLDDELLQLAADRASLKQQLGITGDTTTEKVLNAQLEDALDRAGLNEAQLAGAMQEADVALDRAQLAGTEARSRASALHRDLESAGLEARRAGNALATMIETSWLRGQGLTALTDGATAQVLLAAVDDARERGNQVVERLGKMRGQLAAIQRSFGGVGRHLLGRDPEVTEYFPQLQAWLSQHFSAWFNNTRIRGELLPAADGAVSVDVATREVTWTEAGKPRSRPLAAFSSGEQAFAYTRARLAVLDEAPMLAQNRLIVLDEFGAFIAHDRLAGLLGYLQDRAQDHPSDQVLVILPLSNDYDELAKGASDPDATRYQGMAQQISKRSYAIRSLSA